MKNTKISTSELLILFYLTLFLKKISLVLTIGRWLHMISHNYGPFMTWIPRVVLPNRFKILTFAN